MIPVFIFSHMYVCVCVCVVCFQQNRVSLSILFLTLLSFHLKSYVNTFSHLHSILLSCKVKAQSCLTVISWTVACQAPLSMELSRQEHWSGFALPSTGDHSDPGIEAIYNYVSNTNLHIHIRDRSHIPNC